MTIQHIEMCDTRAKAVDKLSRLAASEYDWLPDG